MTPFPMYVYSVMDPELLSDNDTIFVSALEQCHSRCIATVEAAGTIEFRRYVTAEDNYGRMIAQLLSAFMEQARKMKPQLQAAVEAS